MRDVIPTLQVFQFRLNSTSPFGEFLLLKLDANPEIILEVDDLTNSKLCCGCSPGAILPSL